MAAPVPRAGGGSSSGSAACAACKYQRRRCAPDCPLAPYFPADQPYVFQNAHRLFGVSKILKILEKLDDPQKRNEAMRSIVYQSNVRFQNPVHGCVAVIYNLMAQIHQAQAELYAIQNHIAVARQFHFENQQMQQQQEEQEQQELMLDQQVPLDVNLMAPGNHNNQTSSSGSNNNHGNFNPHNNVLHLFNDEADGMGMAGAAAAGAGAPGHHHVYNSGDIIGDDDGADLNLYWGATGAQQHYMQQMQDDAAYNDVGIDLEQSPSSAAAAQAGFMLPQQGNPSAAVAGYDDFHQYYGPVDDRQSYIDARDAYESSLDKDAVHSTMAEQVSENELKNAAAGFSLTNNQQ